jgi:hypothetical protein
MKKNNSNNMNNGVYRVFVLHTVQSTVLENAVSLLKPIELDVCKLNKVKSKSYN